ncbi:hypothetical protein MTO96_020235 [Rhipicephalus appendiculatus]
MDPVRPLSEDEQLLLCMMINWMCSSNTMLLYVLSQVTPKKLAAAGMPSPRREYSIQAPLQGDKGDLLEPDGDPVGETVPPRLMDGVGSCAF